MKARCLVVDDEPIAVEVIKKHAEKLSSLEITGEANDAVQAFEILQNNKIDLIFLDIQMPGITGLELLKTLSSPPKVIIVSAYREYALEGFELDVVDYLLKPVSFERFLKSINKFSKAVENEERAQPGSIKNESSHLKPTSNPPESENLWIRVERKNMKIPIDKILYVEGLKDYVKIYLETEMVISKISMKEMETKLPDSGFIRIHRSYLVAKKKIKAFNNEEVEIGNKSLPIGRSYKADVLEVLSVL